MLDGGFLRYLAKAHNILARNSQGAPSRSLMASLALRNKEPTLERLITRFIKSTKGDLELRTFENFLTALDQILRTSKDEVAYEHLARWRNIHRGAQEPFLEYFIRFEDGMAIAEDHGCLGGAPVLCIKTLLPLRLNTTQQATIDILRHAALEAKPDQPLTWEHL